MKKGSQRVGTLACFLALAFSLVYPSSLYGIELSKQEQDYIGNKGTVRFVSQTRYPPFEFTDKDGQHEGMMLDVIRWLGVEIGFKPVFVDMTFQQAQEAVLSNEADVITSLFYSDKRNETFEFTSTLFEVPASIFVQAHRTDIKELTDLNGKTIAIQKGDYARDFLELKNIRFEILHTDDFGEAADMVAAGKADAVIGDEQIVIYHIFSNRLTDRIKKAGSPLYTGKNCMASNKQNAMLIGILNKGIEEARKSGVLDKVSKKWLGTIYGARESWFERHFWPLSIGIAGVLLLSLAVWIRNVSLQIVVREKTEDIRRSDEALLQSEAKYRDLFENASDIIYTHDLHGNYASVNGAAKRILGYTAEEFLSLNFRDIIDPENMPETVEQLRKKIENGVETTGPYELRARSKDGTPFWFEVTSRIMKDNGKPSGVHGMARDITDRKRAEEALKESQEKYRLVVENANESIIVAQDGVLRFVNPKTTETIGYSEQELISMPFLDFIHPDDRTMVAERHQRRLQGQHPPDSYAFRVIDKSGNIKWMEINAVAVTWEGRPATLNFLADTTARRQMEAELVKVQKLESLGVLAGGIAHDFNNILTAILGNISLARMNGLSPERVATRLVEAEKACLQAQGLTQQLLTFSKGGAPIKKTVDIARLIEDSCNFAVRGSNVRCRLSIPGDISAVDVDEGQIGQVVNNLAINSVHAMPQGGMIHVRAENVTATAGQGLPLKEGKYVKFVVSDHGVGIPESILRRIFDPYFTTKHKGSGLGLATCFSIIQNHEGLITVESEVGVGTSFHVYLPASEQELRISSDLEESATGGRGRILVMDDEDSVRDVARAILLTLGYEVELAKDGAEAISLYKTTKDTPKAFDAVILDLTVPGGMGGAEAMKELRTIDPKIKAVVSSGYSNDPLMAEFAQHGFAGVVAKPYTTKDLSATLKHIMSLP
jgi:PAS domain S-box-containing protein